VEDQGAEKPVFSPVRWQTWLQAEEMRLDNTGLYKTMEMLLGSVGRGENEVRAGATDSPSKRQ
jgi:hypothetical protein